MSRESINGFRRFLFWIGYDGSCFTEMAKGNSRHGIVDFFELCLLHCVGCQRSELRNAPASRTDKFVHALRTPILVQLPLKYSWIDQTHEHKFNLISDFNRLSSTVAFGSLKLIDFHGVAPGFDHRNNISYRKYVYRIYAAKNWETFESFKENPSLVSFSEANYGWQVHPSFDIHKAQKVCEVLQFKTHNFASFFKHSKGDRLRGTEYRDTFRKLNLMQIEKGEAYSVPNDDYDYYNVVIVSRSFVREQIRRIMAVLVHIACGRKPLQYLNELLRHPDPKTFFGASGHIISAPPGGLFLADVVYDYRMFDKPVPFYTHNWDSIDQQNEIENH